LKISFKSERVLILDGFLSNKDLNSLWMSIHSLRFNSVNIGVPASPWSSTDGEPLIGPVSVIQEGKHTLEDHQLKKVSVYPTNSPIDLVFDALKKHYDLIQPIVGVPGIHWNCLTATPYLYPVGTGLSWHSDNSSGSRQYSGAFSFYIHPKWKDNWGGELMVSDQNMVTGFPKNFEKDLKDKKQFPSRLQRDLDIPTGHNGQFFSSVPNRIIFVKGGTWHKINHVSLAAGNNVRTSIAGFFMVPKRES
jgi:hypothetical protein